MPIVRLPGGPALHYQEWGRPDGAVVLLLHGLGSSSDSWRHVGNALGERFRIIAPDARGHGGSEWTHDYSFEAMHDDVARTPARVGHSRRDRGRSLDGRTHRVRDRREPPRSDPAAGARRDAATRPGRSAPADPAALQSRRQDRLAGGDRGPPLAEQPAVILVGSRREDPEQDAGDRRHARATCRRTGSRRSAGASRTPPSPRSRARTPSTRSGRARSWASSSRSSPGSRSKCSEPTYSGGHVGLRSGAPRSRHGQ